MIPARYLIPLERVDIGGVLPSTTSRTHLPIILTLSQMNFFPLILLERDSDFLSAVSEIDLHIQFAGVPLPAQVCPSYQFHERPFTFLSEKLLHSACDQLSLQQVVPDEPQHAVQTPVLSLQEKLMAEIITKSAVRTILIFFIILEVKKYGYEVKKS